MQINQCIMTNNDCYKEAAPMKPHGIVVHSTGANNPYLLRYVQPDDGRIGVNKYNNSWNRPGVEVSTHAMIGKLYNDDVACYQLLPWNIACWGVGRGSNGSYNYDPTGHIQFEICEDALDDREYFNAAFNLAEDLCAYLCKTFELTVDSIVSHAEAGKAGYGSHHGDPDHWLKRFGLTMDDFRAEVKTRMQAGETDGKDAGTMFNVGDVVYFKGGNHYVGASATSAAGTPAAGNAKVTVIAEGATHPYHIVHTDSVSSVYGWVDADKVQAIGDQGNALKAENEALKAENADLKSAVQSAIKTLSGVV